MSLTIDTCMMAVYIFLFFFGPLLFIANTIGILLAIYAMSCCFFLGPQTLMPSTTRPRAKFKQLKWFLNNVPISILSANGQWTKQGMICSHIN